MSQSSYFLKALLAAKKSKVMVSVFVGEDNDTHHTGYVVEANDSGVTLEHYTADGAPDGKVLLKMDSAFHVDIDGQYERKITFLAKHYDQVF